MQDIIDCIRAELGAGTTKNAVFQHIQSLPRGQQKEALLASAALPLLFRPREVQGQCSVMVVWEDGEICREIPL